MRRVLVLASLALWGCKGGGADETDTDADPPDDTDVEAGDTDGDTDVGGDPYDHDGDGYVPDAYAELSTLPAGDCNDDNAAVHPGATELWYSGEDEPCDGGDDWDQDGDAWQKGSLAFEAARDTYAAKYGLELAEAQWGDCDDEDPDVNPGVVADEWYDGIDADCDGADDHDKDGDGYRGESFGDDCDDEDPDVNPGVPDALGDGVDSDCSGSDLPAIETASWTHTNPRNVVAVRDEGRYLLFTAADAVSTSTTLAWPGLLYWWEAPGATPDDMLVWQNPVASSAGEIGPTVAALASGGSFFATLGYVRHAASIPYSYVVGRGASWDAVDVGYELESLKVSAVRDTTDLPTDHDVYETTSGHWALGCAPDRLWWLFLDATGLTHPGQTDLTGGDTCFLEPAKSTTAMIATVCDGAACTRYDIDTSGTIAVAASQPWTTAYTLANRRGEWLVLVEPDGGVTLAEDSGTVYADLLAEHADIRDADVAWHDETVFVALAVGDRTGDGLGDAILAWGSPDSLDQAVIPFDDGATVRDVAHVSVHADESTLFLAFSGDDGIGWSFAAR